MNIKSKLAAAFIGVLGSAALDKIGHDPWDTCPQTAESFIRLLTLRLPDEHRKDFVFLTTDFRTLKKEPSLAG